MDQQDISDEDIARKVQGGDPDAFGALIDRYESKLRRYAGKFIARDDDVDDIVQESFINAYRNIKGFDASRRFSPWIYRIAHNACMNTLRKNSRFAFNIDLDTLISHQVYEDPAATERERADMRAMLDRGLSNISPKYREVLLLHYYEDMGYQDIADVLQIPIGTVGVRIKRGREALKKSLENNI